MQIIRKYLSGFQYGVVFNPAFHSDTPKQKRLQRGIFSVSFYMKRSLDITAALIYGVRLYGICLTFWKAVSEMKAELKRKKNYKVLFHL